MDWADALDLSFGFPERDLRGFNGLFLGAGAAFSAAVLLLFIVIEPRAPVKFSRCESRTLSLRRLMVVVGAWGWRCWLSGQFRWLSLGQG